MGNVGVQSFRLVVLDPEDVEECCATLEDPSSDDEEVEGQRFHLVWPHLGRDVPPLRLEDLDRILDLPWSELSAEDLGFESLDAQGARLRVLMTDDVREAAPSLTERLREPEPLGEQILEATGLSLPGGSGLDDLAALIDSEEFTVDADTEVERMAILVAQTARSVVAAADGDQAVLLVALPE